MKGIYPQTLAPFQGWKVGGREQLLPNKHLHAMGTMDDDKSQAPSVPENDGAVEEEHEDPTVDAVEEPEDIWARAEGYTPLADVQYSSLMVSLGPDDSDDDSDFYKDEETDGAQHQELATEEVTTEAAGVAPTNDFDFQNIADRALSFLDQEYQQTLRGERNVPSWEPNFMEEPQFGCSPQTDPPTAAALDPPLTTDTSQELQDMKAIAAVFDARKEAEAQGGFVADWETLETQAPSSNNTTAASTGFKSVPAESTRPEATVDTDAVRKVVQALAGKTDSKFQARFAAWTERQQSLPPAHDIIPPTPYKAFLRSTQKAKQATASLSRSATLAEAMVRLFGGQDAASVTHNKSTLLIDVVGVDHVECESMERIQNTFTPFVKWLGAWKGCTWQHVKLRLIGRDLVERQGVNQQPINLLAPQRTRLQTAVATCHCGVYHEWLEANETQDHPDLSIAFNAGVWGYKEWQPTIEFLSLREHSVAVLFTAYTLEECQEDQEVVQESVTNVSGKGQVLWEAQHNPFGSKCVRLTRSSSQEYRENSCWQAWRMGKQ
eukprot:Nitzschia sp. Nitz4//scaffold39_size137210//62809//64455//NITZ4_003201-RA/size137210-processed-gene-0.89-mRNA-1//1//CDS//3329550389//4185//frame0